MISVLVLFGVVEFRVVLSKMKKDFSLRLAASRITICPTPVDASSSP